MSEWTLSITETVMWLYYTTMYLLVWNVALTVAVLVLAIKKKGRE